MTPAKTKGPKGPACGAVSPGGRPALGETPAPGVVTPHRSGGVTPHRSARGGTGLRARLEEAVSLLSSVVSELDPDRLTGADATSLYGSMAGAERLVLAGKALLAPRIEASGVWRESGHRDAASLMASVEGVSPGQARHTLAVGQRLGELPGTADAVRRGELSGPKVGALTGAGILDPTGEKQLLSGAADEPLALVRERCLRTRAATTGADRRAAIRAIHARRHFKSWTDAEGAFCYQGRDTADRGARLLAHLAPMAKAIRRARRQAGGTAEPEAALWADALVALVTRPARIERTGVDPDLDHDLVAGNQSGDAAGADPGGADPGCAPPGAGPAPELFPAVPTGVSDPRGPVDPDALALVDAPPPYSVVVRVDLDVLFGGKDPAEGCCELEGVGPVPATMARDLLDDAFLKVVFHRAGDIRAISHLGRTIKASLRTAVVDRDRHCVVPGCLFSAGLEIDHVLPVTEGGPTELDNLALLCHHHHFLKTNGGWTLTKVGTKPDGTPAWSFVPQPPFGQEPALGIDTPEGRKDWHRQQE
jgi:hypothetical protein